MYIVDKERRCIINISDIATIHLERDVRSIKAKFSNTDGCRIGLYNTETESKAVIEMIAEHINIGKNDVFYMPSDDEVKAKLIQQDEKWHHATGKKTKGYGGS